MISASPHNNYSCNISCSENSAVIWTINKKPLQTWPFASFSAGNDYKKKASNEDSMYTEYLEIETGDFSFLPLQCASLYQCVENSVDCISTICFSESLQISMFQLRVI